MLSHMILEVATLGLSASVMAGCKFTSTSEEKTWLK